MHVFVTGAAGFVGSVVVPELIAAGHTVLGLARSDANEQALVAAGAQVHRGSLEDIESLKSGAAQSDGVIHLAFIHDFSKFAENGQIDKRAIEAMGGVLAGSNRPLIVTSGTLLAGAGGIATEDKFSASDEGLPRVSEQAGVSFAAQGVRAMAIRLPPVVHGGDKFGLVSQIIAVAREKGVSAYVGEGQNRWPAGHRRDAATLYRLALEKGTAGAIYHAVGEEGVVTKDIAAVIGKRLSLPVNTMTADEAMVHFGFPGMFWGMDVPASSAKTQEELGWRPTQSGLLSDLETNDYATA